jgi:aryl-alcohol dehydrogenase-like predicted oxidoreductase
VRSFRPIPRSLDHYRLLGRSGLRVSPLALGGTGLGNTSGYGSSVDESRRMFDIYVDHGGNFIDVANLYNAGESESLVGDFSQGRRNDLVIATKFGGDLEGGGPGANLAGSHRRSMMVSVEKSLKRLKTDYIDLLYLHAWDGRTHPDEIMRGFEDLVSAGKVLYAGISNTPAWQIARMQTIADLRGWSPLVALEIEYNLVQRDADRELIPAAEALGIGVVGWRIVGGGALTGKYGRGKLPSADEEARRPQGFLMNALEEKTLDIIDVVNQVADELGRSPSEVAVAWALTKITVPILGVTSVKQLEGNLGAFSVNFDDGQLERLEQASTNQRGYPHDFLASDPIRHVFVGAKEIQ